MNDTYAEPIEGMADPEPIQDRIQEDERTWAAGAHLSGLAYLTVVPFAGILLPIIVMMAKKDQPVVRAVAQQALILNIATLVAAAMTVVMFLTVILIPVGLILALVTAVAQFALPIYGAIRAMDGHYYRYPIVGIDPSERF